MIADAGTGSSFGGLFKYLMHGRSRGLQDYLLGDPERVAWTATRNLPLDDPQLAARIMEATAHQNDRVQKPVYHLSLSAAPGEDFTREQWERIAERVLRDIGLDEHQALLVAHRDTNHAHIHLMINRVHPQRLKAWDNSYDYPRIERSLRHLEREWNLREVPGRHYHLRGQERPERDNGLTAGERREKERTQEEVWAERVRFRIRRDIQRAQGWADLEHRLKRHGLRLKKRGRGLVVTDGKRMVKASRIHRGSSYAKLAERFGSTFEEWREHRDNLREAVRELEWRDTRERELRWHHSRYDKKLTQAWIERNKLKELRAKENSSWRSLEADVRGAFRPRHHSTAWKRLEDVATRHGWEHAVEVLEHEPERLGRLRGHELAGWGTDERIYARSTARRAAQALRQAAEGRRLIAHAEQKVSATQHLIQEGRAGQKWVEKALDHLPSKRAAQRQVERLALRIGLRAVELVLPRPAAVTVRAAVKTMERVREAARGRGRER